MLSANFASFQQFWRQYERRLKTECVAWSYIKRGSRNQDRVTPKPRSSRNSIWLGKTNLNITTCSRRAIFEATEYAINCYRSSIHPLNMPWVPRHCTPRNAVTQTSRLIRSRGSVSSGQCQKIAAYHNIVDRRTSADPVIRSNVKLHTLK